MSKILRLNMTTKTSQWQEVPPPTRPWAAGP